MNHTLYFNDEKLYDTFCKTSKQTYGSVSKALTEAMQLWLNKNQSWSKTMQTLPHQSDEFRFEEGRSEMNVNLKDPW